VSAAGVGDMVLVRHAPTMPAPGVPAAAWRLAPGAMELTAALGMALARLRLAAPGGAGNLGPIDGLVASHEPKALATARTLGLVLGLQADVASGLEEHHRDKAPYLDDAEHKRTLRRFFERPGVLVFGSESADEARTRFVAGVDAALAAHPGRRLALVSHATVIALALARANGQDPFTLWGTLRSPEAIVVRRDGWRIVERLGLEDA